ncbi:MAG TPA: ribosome recycling factor [Candidatus Binatia bacterium]|nr:ribosome recycling factor [Candidatus Binatia bacterium]
MPQDYLSTIHPKFQQVIDFLKSDISALRTGRANPGIVEGVMVEAYGARTPLSGLASITIPDPRSILIEPWDKSLVKGIEKGIQEAKLGLNPSVQGTQVRIMIPAPTEETRKALVKTLGEKLEHARKSVRNVRDEAKGEIQKAEKEKEISEDEKYKLLEQLDKTAAGMNDRIKNIGDEKEREIMTI